MKSRKLGKRGIVVIASPQSCLLIALMMTMIFFYQSMIWLPPPIYNICPIYFSRLLSWMIMITNSIHLMQIPIWTILTLSINILQIVIIFLNQHLSTSHIQYLSDILFSPFELNDYDHQFDTFDADPDLNYFNSFNQYITNCNYFLESAFINEMSKSYQMKQNFSLCHLNIRSMRKKLKSFENYLDLIGHRFTILAFTETWLKDNDCDLFSIPGYHMLENHRPNQLGGGVAICLRNDVQFIPRHDLAVFDDHMESVFAEISKDVLGTKKCHHWSYLPKTE